MKKEIVKNERNIFDCLRKLKNLDTTYTNSHP